MTNELSQSEIKQLAKATAVELAKRMSFMMSLNDIALFFGYAPNSSVLNEIVSQPDFPRPAQLTMRGRDRWLRSDVEGWARGKYSVSGSDILRAMRR